MTPTQPSSTPITAEGAVTKATIQRLAELHFYQEDAASMDIRLHRFARALIAHCAPQDAKAEQVHCIVCDQDITGSPAALEDCHKSRAPAASNVEAVNKQAGELDFEQALFLKEWAGLDADPGKWPEHFCHAWTGWLAHERVSRQSAPIEAGELPPLPRPEIQDGGCGHDDDAMRAYGKLCRDTLSNDLVIAHCNEQIEGLTRDIEKEYGLATKPASTPASASIADDAEFFQLLQDWYLQYPNTKSLPLYRKIVDHIDARQSVAAPDSRSTDKVQVVQEAHKSAGAAPDTIEVTRANFEDWHVTHIEGAKIGSQDCAARWSAWLAGSTGHYKARDGWKIAPQPWSAPFQGKASDAEELTEAEILRIREIADGIDWREVEWDYVAQEEFARQVIAARAQQQGEIGHG